MTADSLPSRAGNRPGQPQLNTAINFIQKPNLGFDQTTNFGEHKNDNSREMPRLRHAGGQPA